MTPWDNHAPKRRKTAISNIEKLRFTECVPMNQRLKFNILRGIHERELKQPAQDFRSWKRDFHTEKHIQGKISDLNVGNCACGRVADKKIIFHADAMWGK